MCSALLRTLQQMHSACLTSGSMTTVLSQYCVYNKDYLWFRRWVPGNTGRDDSRNSVRIHLIHSCIATEPVECL